MATRDARGRFTSVGDVGIRVNANLDDFSRQLQAEVPRAAGAAGVTAGKSFGDQFKSTFSKANIGKGLMQGLGFGLGLGAVGIAAQGVRALTSAIGDGIGAAIDWESSMAGVSKTLDTTGLSSEQAAQALADIGQGLRDMAKEIPIPVDELAALAEAGGALGIARDDLMSFVRTSALLGTTTTLSAQDAATAMGKISAVMPIAREQYSRFAATLVDLGNKGSSTEDEIVSMAQRMSGVAGLIQLSHDELLSWAAALANAGVQAEAGGGSFQKFALGINTMVSQGTPRLKEIAEVAGLTADAFSDLWQQDASEAMRLVVNGLGDLDQGARQAKLAALGFTDIRITQALLGLTNNVAGPNGLNNALMVGEGAWKANSAAAIEAEKRFGTTESKIALLNGQLHDFAIDAGGVLVDLGLFLGDLLNAVRRGVDSTGAAISDTRAQVRLMARERGLDEAAAVAAYDAQVKRDQMTAANIAELNTLMADLRGTEFAQIQSALDLIDRGASITAGGFEDLVARVEAMGDPAALAALTAMRQGMTLTADEALALGRSITQVREDSIVILTDDLRDLAVELGPGRFAEVLNKARVEMSNLGLETDNLDVLMRLLREGFELVGPAADEAAAGMSAAMDVINRILIAQDPQQGGQGLLSRGIAADIKHIADLPDRFKPEIAEAGETIAFDLTGGFREGIKGSEATLREAMTTLRLMLDFDWAAEAGVALGKKFGLAVGEGLASTDQDVVEEAQQLALGGLEAIDKAGREGPLAADRIGELLGGLYASGLTRAEVDATLAAQGVSLAALEEVAKKKGWHLAGTGPAAAWVQGVKDKAGPGPGTADEAGDVLNKSGADAARATSRWKTGGEGVGAAWVAGLVASVAAAGAAGGSIYAALEAARDLLQGGSPPPKGPLSNIDIGGLNAGLAWSGGFAKGITDIDILGALGSLNAAMPGSFDASITGTLAPINVGPSVVRHEVTHHIDQATIEAAHNVGGDRLVEVLLTAAATAGTGYLR